MKIFSALAAASVCLSSVSIVVAQEINEVSEKHEYVLSEETQRLSSTYSRMLRYYDQRNFSSVRSVRVLMGNYPHHVEPILHAAFERYPKHYRHIIKAAIDAEPAFTREIISTALNLKVADPADIVRIAVEAEPSYAEMVVATVNNVTPESLDTAVRVAVLTEPQTADSILRANRNAELSTLNTILQSILSAVPTLGSYLVDTISDLIGSSEESIDVNNQRAIELIRSAYTSGGLDKEQANALAKKHELTNEEVALIFKD